MDEQPIGPAGERVIDLTPHKALVDAYLGAQREADRWEEMANILKGQIQAMMGENTHAVVDGTPTLTYKQVGRFIVGRFKDEEPALYARYYRTRTVTELDLEAIRAELPDVYERFRGRVFNRLVKP